jgi:hypothetical protein
VGQVVLGDGESGLVTDRPGGVEVKGVVCERDRRQGLRGLVGDEVEEEIAWQRPGYCCGEPPVYSATAWRTLNEPRVKLPL